MFSVTSFANVLTLGGSIYRLPSADLSAFHLELLLFKVHHDKSGCIPYLVCEVTACLHTLHVESMSFPGAFPVISVRRGASAPVLVNDFQRINTVS